MTVRAYLRASTKDQDATRAEATLKKFAADHGFKINSRYVENASGASLARPVLFKLLSEADDGDILLIEQIDRLSRLTAADWEKLKTLIADKKLRIVSLDLPTSYDVVKDPESTTGRIMVAINAMLLDIIAATSRKDWEDRRRRTAEGQAKAIAAGKYVGRREDTTRLEMIRKLLETKTSYSDIEAMTGASRATIAKVSKRRQDAMATAAE